MDKSSRGLRYFVDIRKGEVEPAALFFSFWFLVIVVFQALRSLHATRSPLREIGAISQLAMLEDLDISDTPIDELRGLEGLANLKAVNCAGTQIRKLDPLRSLHQLESLDCSNTRVSKLDPVMYLSIRTLKAYNTKISTREVDEFRENNPDAHVVYYR